MSDALTNPPFFGGIPGEPVPQVDPEDLKALRQEMRNLQSRHSGRNVAIGFHLMQAVCKPGANVEALWYRSSMIWALTQFAQVQMAPWIKEEEVSDAVFRIMATIPMEWIGTTEREGLPFDVEEFFRQLRESETQNG